MLSELFRPQRLRSAVLIVLVCTAALPGASETTPARSGESRLTTYWDIGLSIERLGSYETSREAIERLAEIGALAVPELISVIEGRNAHDDRRDREAVAARRRVGPAMEALGRIGPHAAPAVPSLVGILEECSEDRSLCETAIRALGGIGPAASPALPLMTRIALDESLQRGVFSRTVSSAMEKIGPAAISYLAQLMAPSDYIDHSDVQKALWRLGSEDPRVHAALLKGLENEDWRVRDEAAELLGRTGPSLRNLVPRLIEVLEEEQNWEVRTTIVSNLGLVRPARRDVVRILARSLEDEESGVRYEAADALWNLGPEARPAVPSLIRALEDEDDSIRELAVQTLGAMRPTTPRILRALVGALDNDPPMRVRRTAPFRGFLVVEIFKEMRPSGEPAIPLLIRVLRENEDGYARRGAAMILGWYGSQEAVPALRQALLDEGPGVPGRAEDALGRINHGVPPFLLDNLADLEASDPAARCDAAAGFCMFADDIRLIPPSLRAAARDPDPKVRIHALCALARVGEAPVDAVAYLVQALEDPPVPYAEGLVVEVLGSIGPPAAHTAGRLLPFLEEEDGDSRAVHPVKILEALGRMGPGAAEVVPALEDFYRTTSDEWSLRPVVVRTLGRIGAPRERICPFLLEAMKSNHLGERQAAWKAWMDAGCDAGDW